MQTGYELNTEAYKVFVQLEVGVREFIIGTIKNKGVNEWMTEFLGRIHVDSIREIGKRIYEANEKQQEPDVEDVYYYKISKETKNNTKLAKSHDLLHPFYYLSWSDLIGMLGKSATFTAIAEVIGKEACDMIIKTLVSLNFLRNDIAHSRFITSDNLFFIKNAFNVISSSIPDFFILSQKQYNEESFEHLIEKVNKNLELITSSPMLELDQLISISVTLDKLINSFWLNSLFIHLVPTLKNYKKQLLQYIAYRTTPGGLLKIQKWKKENLDLLNELKNLLDERKISN